MPESPPPDLKRFGWLYLAGLLAVGSIAYFSSPASQLFSKAVFLCVGFTALAILAGVLLLRLLDGRLSDALAQGLSLFFGGLVFFPAARYIHDNLDWVFHPGAAPYTFARHAFVFLVASLALVAGRWLNRD
ncbi:MAG: hypothetical protein LAN84_04975 [Acidobacteriia bacterium]|nr:hypothetical protein [Terriglobia bacterium]